VDKFPVFKRWDIPSVYGFEKTVMQEAAAEIMRLFPERSPSRLDDIKTVIAEACLNAIEHGNGGDANLTVTIQLTAERDKVSFRIYDQGAATAVIDQNADVPLSDKWELPRPRGWGLTIISRLSDHCEFGQCEGKTCLDIIFYW
jgi:serine/threonine-protein kinase RsbW